MSPPYQIPLCHTRPDSPALTHKRTITRFHTRTTPSDDKMRSCAPAMRDMIVCAIVCRQKHDAQFLVQKQRAKIHRVAASSASQMQSMQLLGRADQQSSCINYQNETLHGSSSTRQDEVHVVTYFSPHTCLACKKT
eukprot:6213713-Pleurochrysis_carterae.AAC.1